MKRLMKKVLNLFVVPAYAARTTASDPLQKFKFSVAIPGLPTSIGFQKISGLTEETNVAEYNEGGTDFTMKMPGIMSVGEVVCERGEYADTNFHDLMHRTLTDMNLRNTVVITKKNRYGDVARVYKLANAWVSKWEGSEMDAGSDDVAIEKITIQFEYYLR